MLDRRTLLRFAGTVPLVLSASSLPSLPLPGDRKWREVFFDHFEGDRRDGIWSAYDSVPKSDPRIRWRPDMVSVQDSRLILWGGADSDGLTSGGVSLWKHPQTYGKWEVGLRSHPSRTYSYHILLWPQNENWPPEIDFAESFDGTRGETQAFIHYRDSAGAARKVEFNTFFDATVDHTVAVEWTPDSVRLLRNGREWGTVTGEMVPHTPMWLALQVESQALGRDGNVAPGTRQKVLEVDWVRISVPD